MKIFNSLETFVLPSELNSSETIALTIGNFDGIHLGHSAVLNRLKEKAVYPIVFTFSNHPSEILRKEPISRLTTLSHKLSLLQATGVAATILIPFTEDFSKQSAYSFLRFLKEKIPFTRLILGHDAKIGHDRKQNLQEDCEKLNIQLEYISPVRIENEIISSSKIRNAILHGDLKRASSYLGRPYSISSTVQAGEKKGEKIGFHTANLTVDELTLPPFGVYAVSVCLEDGIYPAVANLGQAPTLHKNRAPLLEVHLIDMHKNLYDKNLEVIFISFLRREKKFESLHALREQISRDIQTTKNLFRDSYCELNV